MQVSGLDEGTDYQFRVYAVNQIGKSRPKIFDGLACTKKVSGSATEVVSSFTNASVLGTSVDLSVELTHNLPQTLNGSRATSVSFQGKI